MLTKIQIKNRYSEELIFEYECENNNIKKTLLEAISKGANLSSANLRGADLYGADLRSADLRSADLSVANLRSADLYGANLYGANLRSADLRSADLSVANLRGAVTNFRYISISCIGSAKRMTTYCFEDDIIWCGCWKGSLAEFEKRVSSIYLQDNKHYKEYTGAIAYIKSLV